VSTLVHPFARTFVCFYFEEYQ